MNESQGNHMNSITKLLVLTALATPFAAHAGDNDACKPVFEACAAQGYAKDDATAAPMKIWLNCASVILEQKKAVAKVDVDPNGWDATNCRDYRIAKDKFDAEWAKKHKKTK
jgi:hypothetical protein